MYADKINKKSISPIQKKASPISENHGKYDNSERMLGYCFDHDHADENNALSETLQLRAAAFYHTNVIQLANKYGDNAKLKANSFGHNPVSTLNLTCHHIIPNTSLEVFYEICNSYACMDKDISDLFEKWKEVALTSAENSKELRSVGEEDLEDRQLFAYSGCMWMCGNIFIGPASQNRVDDPGNSFDYGAYTSNSNNPGVTDNGPRNEQVDELKRIHEKLKSLVMNYKSESDRQSSSAPWDKQLLIDGQDRDKIIEILTALINIAAKPLPINTESIDNASNPPAYNKSEWISVGRIPIKDMDNEYPRFLAIHDTYRTLYERTKSVNRTKYGLRLTPEELDFCSYCCYHFKDQGLKLNLIKDQEWVISKYIFLIVNQKYEACTKVAVFFPPPTE